MSRFLSSLLPKAKPDSYIPLDTHDIPHPTSPSPSRPSRRGRIPSLLRTHGPLVYILVLHGLIIALILRSHHNPFRTPPPPPPTPPPAAPQTPALDLTPEGLAKFGVEALYERQSRTLRQATARYELKTGRKTPRGFAKWFEWVSERGLLVDEYDQVYRDFQPFHDLKDAAHVRRMLQQDRENVESGGTQMFSFLSEAGRVRRTSDGGPFDGSWEGILQHFAADVPDFTAIFNYQDEPRVVFDVRNPSARSRAWNLTDTQAFRQNPSPLSDFFVEQGNCIFPNSPTGLFERTNEEDAFLIAAVSMGFSTDLRMVISQTKISPCFADILTPSIYYYRRDGWGPSEPYTDPDPIAWDDKVPKLYWRGSTSGGATHGQNYHHFQRLRFMDLADARPDLIDAKFARYVYCNEMCDEIEQAYPLVDRQPWQDAYPFRYVFDIDGNTFSGRFLGLLQSNSLVFKSTIWTEFFADWLKPYVHYVPVKPDLSDLYEKIEWARRSPLEAHRIACAGREMARRVMTDDQLDAYAYAVMLELAELQRDDDGGQRD